jgi:hypothetical protein
MRFSRHGTRRPRFTAAHVSHDTYSLFRFASSALGVLSVLSPGRMGAHSPFELLDER